MKLTQLWLTGYGSRPELTIDRIGPELNAFVGPPRTGKSTVAHLAAHLLYGKVEVASRVPSDQRRDVSEGSIEVESPRGRYLLRRHRDGSPHGRLSVASISGPAVDSHTVRSLLCDIPPRLLASVYAVDFTHAPNPSALLQGEMAREITTVLKHNRVAGAAAGDARSALGTIDRQHVDELIRLRDEATRKIEEQMSGSRRLSTELEAELREVDSALANRRRQLDPVQAKLRAVEGKLAEIAATLRFFSLESAVRRGPQVDEQQQREAIERLDAEIGRCRQTLSDLQLRDATVRRELAEVHPDGTADSASCLADQRATVGVFERLLDDLDAEVSQLARSHEPGRGMAYDSHARLSPVAQMLRQQLYALCGQVTEQERTVRRLQLQAEARQLARAQTDLSEQLEHLLTRRQGLVHESQLALRPAVTLPQPPAAAHCQCEGHDTFIRTADAMLLARSDRSRREQTAQAQRAELERERDELRASCDMIQAEIHELDARWQRLQHERGHATERSALDELRRELERIEAEIARALAGGAAGHSAVSAAPHRRAWKASDVLAQLTGGELSQIIVPSETEAVVIANREGRSLSVGQLSPAQQDQLYLAITLALVSSFASRGVDLPLILDEPFLRQDVPGAAAMAGVLHEFAKSGRQVVLFTESRDAARRLEALGVAAQDLDLLRRRTPHATKSVPAPVTPAAETPATVRIVRDTVDDRQPKLRITGQWTPSDDAHAIFYLTPEASIADFPVLGNETAKIFAGMGIQNVRDLLAADAARVASKLRRPNVTAQTVRLWQSHVSLMCYVPGVSLNEAQVLAANDIQSPDALHSMNERIVAADIAKFLASNRGRRFASLQAQFSVPRLTELRQAARTQRERWLAARGQFSFLEAAPAEDAAAPPKSPTMATAQRAKRVKMTPAPAVRPASHAQRAPLRFLLDCSSAVAEAPSIGPAVGDHLGRAGIRTVADLLKADPESTAEEIGEPTISASTISRWQSEARLACRIPELRCGGAQLLVATGLTEPEQVAGAKLDELYKKVRQLCRGPQGKRLLREGKAPSRERVAQWIRHAAHMRPLEAA